ncbi:putative protein T-ENOL isoform X2 [Budorcas taxicolor]|uniref:putative protein T-ENOL isoform X2 n=1 Tax=Budorcas taxicolor TaxID=37181 RepID=UPI0022843154|nr:putative protein T-ENOL isoform X2 [Budorcas taxicolor]
MSSTLARNEEKKGSRPSQPTTPATSLGCNLKVSRSEEFLTQISTELTDEALFVAAYHMNPVPIKEKQTQDRGTQISKHAPTETVPAQRHISCHPLARRELSLAT